MNRDRVLPVFLLLGLLWLEIGDCGAITPSKFSSVTVFQNLNSKFYAFGKFIEFRFMVHAGIKVVVVSSVSALSTGNMLLLLSRPI